MCPQFGNVPGGISGRSFPRIEREKFRSDSTVVLVLALQAGWTLGIVRLRGTRRLRGDALKQPKILDEPAQFGESLEIIGLHQKRICAELIRLIDIANLVR